MCLQEGGGIVPTVLRRLTRWDWWRNIINILTRRRMLILFQLIFCQNLVETLSPVLLRCNKKTFWLMDNIIYMKGWCDALLLLSKFDRHQSCRERSNVSNSLGIGNFYREKLLTQNSYSRAVNFSVLIITFCLEH